MSEQVWNDMLGRPESPDYYRAGQSDCADIVNDFALNYWTGSAVVHILRAGRKPGESRRKALENALVCLQHELAAMGDE